MGRAFTGSGADLTDVVACLAVGRYPAAILRNRAGARVVGRERQLLVAVVLVEQLAEVVRAAANVLCRDPTGCSRRGSRAVAGISCISPIAPFGDSARGLKPDSTWMTARTSSGRSDCRVACSWISGSKSRRSDVLGRAGRHVCGRPVTL